MTRDEMTALFARRRDAWRRHDSAALAADHAEDAVLVSPMFGNVTGRAAIEAAYRSLLAAFPDWDLRDDDLVMDGDRAAEFVTIRGTHSGELGGLPATGKQFEMRGASLFRFRGDQIAHERRVSDFTGFLLQIGVLKAKPARP